MTPDKCRRTAINGRRRQEGSVLFVSVILLVALTMIALAATRTSTTQLRIVGNVQATQRVEAASQLAIEQVVGSVDAFANPTQPVVVSDIPLGITVTVADRTCLGAKAASGFSAVAKISPEDTIWNVTAEADDSLTGAKATVSQGVRVRMLSGACT